MLLMFYLAMPPWPGVPLAPGPDHSLWINKNLIEVVALLVIASLPTGRWFGLDTLVGRLPLKTAKKQALIPTDESGESPAAVSDDAPAETTANEHQKAPDSGTARDEIPHE